MKAFIHIHRLIPYIDDAFSSFYDAMLGDGLFRHRGTKRDTVLKNRLIPLRNHPKH